MTIESNQQEKLTFKSESLADEIKACDFEATYSVEDNKLRLRTHIDRVSRELFGLLKEAGFKYAPIQELYVAPRWTVGREDICLFLAGSITAEDITLVERAEAKAARLDALSEKRQAQSDQFFDAAKRIAERFEGGQPILLGHHSQRKAEKDKARMEAAQSKAAQALEAVDYWRYRATGVERHANSKASDRTRVNRIKTLLAELRDKQRTINSAHKAIELWMEILAMTDQEVKQKNGLFYSGVSEYVPNYSDYDMGLWRRLDKGEITVDQCAEISIAHMTKVINSRARARAIAHTLGRLDYERSELGEVVRFEGELTPVILQGFARTHGAEKPKAKKTNTGYLLSSSVPLPLHIADGETLELSEEAWRDLMQDIGYTVEIKEREKPKKQTCPLINPTPEEAEKLQALWNEEAARKSKNVKASTTATLSQKFYSANSGGSYSKLETIELDENGYRIWSSWNSEKVEPACRVRIGSSNEFYGASRVIIISDKPQKALPVSFKSKFDAEAA